MRRLTLLGWFVGSLLVGTWVYAQEETEENLQYEELKVLEPIIGTWTSTRQYDDTGEQVETETTYVWSKTKKMILATSRQREIKDGEVQPWMDQGPRYFYVWNGDLKCIEVYAFFANVGAAQVLKVVPQGSGAFELVRTQGTTGAEVGGFRFTIVGNEIRSLSYNRKGPDGEVISDRESVGKRAR